MIAQRILLGISSISLVLILSLTSSSVDWRPDYRPPALAIKDARIQVKPGQTIENGTIIVRRGIVESVGAADKAKIPADALIVEGKGLTVYPGWIDAYTLNGLGAGVRSKTGSGRNLPTSEFASPFTPPDDRIGITPEFAVADSLSLGDPAAEARRKLGFTSQIVAPGGAILTGQGALAATTGQPRREVVIVPRVGLHINLRAPFEPNPASEGAPVSPSGRFRGGPQNQMQQPSGYPSALMGVVAHLRQQVLDAKHHQDLLKNAKAEGQSRVASDPSLETILEAIDGKLPVWWQAETLDEIHRALDLSKEFGFKPVIVGGREAFKAVDRLKSEQVPVILRLNHPAKPKVPTQEEFAKKSAADRVEPLRVQQDHLDRWKKRVGTAGVLNKSGIRIAFSTDGLQRADLFLEKIRDLIAEGLPEAAAAEILSAGGASMAHAENRLGTLEPGKYGHLVALTGGLNDSKSKVRLVAADGFLFDMDAPTVLPKEPESPSGGGSGRGPGSRDQAKSSAKEAEKKSESTKTDEGSKLANKPETKAAAKPKDAASKSPETKSAGLKPDADKAKSKGSEAKPLTAKTAEKPFVDTLTELESDRAASLKTGGNVFIRNATVITLGKPGTLPKASILVRQGKILEIGIDLKKPDGVAEISAEGLFVIPGMIDTHSHMAIQGGVNEATLSIVPEVRVNDVVDGDDPTIYRALAGGTTSARLLHGSANTIGGQDVVIKLRPGQAGRDLILRDSRRPQGVKFALGENVTRRVGRFPVTRMGVEATIERAFQDGAAYSRLWSDWKQANAKDPAKAGPSPRRDLRLEALASIVNGEMKIHSHCYRADEILMLLRTAERHNIKVQSLQHVLEGYKVAAEIAAHGASASTFSDWWAYKIEAFDAVPANAAILTEAGANAVIKSDDPELVRHLNLEAAKSVKYGGMAEEKALAMVTINAARELGLDHRLGTIEVGKDADLAIFDAHPLDTLSQCRLTLVNGEIQFQSDRNLADALKPKKLGSLARRIKKSPQMEAHFKEDVDHRKVRAFVGGRVHTVDGPTISGGVVIVNGNTIQAVGGPETKVPNGAEVFDLKGFDLWPGMIDSGSKVGLFEVGSLRETQDVSDSATFQPELTTSSALNAASELIPVTRANGVLSVLAQPAGGLISGQSSVANLDGWIASQMVIKDKVALHVQIPSFIPPREPSIRAVGRTLSGCACEEMATSQDHSHEAMADEPSPGGPGDAERNQARTRRRQRLEELADQFKMAIRYQEAKSMAQADRREFKTDPRMESLMPYAKGEKPVIFEANHRSEILDALQLTKALNLKAIISGGHEAWKVATELKSANVPVLIGGVLKLPTESFDPYDSSYTNALKLHSQGVKFAIQSGGGGPDEATAARNLPFEAGTAAAFGLPEEIALRSVTLSPAEILGIADQIGSITPGKKANLVVSRGSILQATTVVELLIIDGRVMKPESRHTKLAEKYRERLKQVRAGLAPLGVGAKK